jgi:hypothetical protein
MKRNSFSSHAADVPHIDKKKAKRNTKNAENFLVVYGYGVFIFGMAMLGVAHSYYGSFSDKKLKEEEEAELFEAAFKGEI